MTVFHEEAVRGAIVGVVNIEKSPWKVLVLSRKPTTVNFGSKT